MKRTNWPVEDFGIRPAGPSDKCFYCGELKGAVHKEGCVIRSRTVLVKATIEYLIEIPEDWDTDQIEFHRNEGNWCSNNLINELQSLEDKGVDFCNHSYFEFVREATVEDEHDFCTSVNDIES